MPITSSAKKALRVSLRKRALNVKRKVLIKKSIKAVANQETLNKAVSLIDKGVKWNLFHKNKAARLKSSLSKSITTEVAEPKKAEKKAAAKPVKTTKATKTAPAKKPATKKTKTS